MKVEVLTVDDVKIGKWRWWSNWIDVCLFTHFGEGYLLQMRVGRTNGKQFRHIRNRGMIGWSECNAHEMGDLTQMELDRTK